MSFRTASPANSLADPISPRLPPHLCLGLLSKPARSSENKCFEAVNDTNYLSLLISNTAKTDFFVTHRKTAQVGELKLGQPWGTLELCWGPRQGVGPQGGSAHSTEGGLARDSSCSRGPHPLLHRLHPSGVMA